MIFCPTCRVEMPCSQNGVAVLYGDSHVYMGDAFQCPQCGAEVIDTNVEGHYMPNVRQTAERVIVANE